jgi:hypothetical protein
MTSALIDQSAANNPGGTRKKKVRQYAGTISNYDQ